MTRMAVATTEILLRLLEDTDPVPVEKLIQEFEEQFEICYVNPIDPPIVNIKNQNEPWRRQGKRKGRRPR